MARKFRDRNAMDAMDRLGIIKRLAGGAVPPVAAPAGVYASQHPEERTKRKRPGIYYVDPRPTRIRMEATHDVRADDKLTGWLKEPDPEPVKHVRHKRGYRVHPLTSISQKLPAKLPVLTFCPKTRCRL